MVGRRGEGIRQKFNDSILGFCKGSGYYSHNSGSINLLMKISIYKTTDGEKRYLIMTKDFQ